MRSKLHYVIVLPCRCSPVLLLAFTISPKIHCLEAQRLCTDGAYYTHSSLTYVPFKDYCYGHLEEDWWHSYEDRAAVFERYLECRKLYFILWSIYVSVPIWIQYSLNYCSFIMSWNLEVLILQHLLFFWVDLIILGPLHFHRNFRISFPISTT